jgi:biopolymer transport protein ExbD
MEDPFMVISRREAKARRLSISMTPMIDIVFLLIIFFMCVTEISKLEIESLTLPEASMARDNDPTPPRLTVNVMRNGSYRVGGEDYSSSELKLLVARRVIAGERDAKGHSDLAVRIRADAHVPYKYVQRVMNQCSKARIWQLSFGVSPRPRN